jgi:mRNA-degrading endonuclease RelE of RelBE toxin-antitoxin system
MDFNGEPFEVEFTEQYIEELTEIYEYIANVLKEDNIAKNLLNEVNEKVLKLGFMPEIYMKIGKNDRLNRNYHRMIIKNYIVLYTIDYEIKKIYASHIIYGRRNY